MREELPMPDRLKKIIAERLAKAKGIIEEYKSKRPDVGTGPAFVPGPVNPADYIPPKPDPRYVNKKEGKS